VSTTLYDLTERWGRLAAQCPGDDVALWVAIVRRLRDRCRSLPPIAYRRIRTRLSRGYFRAARGGDDQ